MCISIPVGVQIKDKTRDTLIRPSVYLFLSLCSIFSSSFSNLTVHRLCWRDVSAQEFEFFFFFGTGNSVLNSIWEWQKKNKPKQTLISWPYLLTCSKTQLLTFFPDTKIRFLTCTPTHTSSPLPHVESRNGLWKWVCEKLITQLKKWSWGRWRGGRRRGCEAVTKVN